MTFTYDQDFTVQRDRVRLLYGDQGQDGVQLLQDEELALFLADGAFAATDDRSGAIAAARQVLVKFAYSSVDVTSGDDSIKLSQRIDHVKAALTVLESARDEAIIATPGNSPIPYLGGSSLSDKQGREMDADWVQPSFTRSDSVFSAPWNGGWS